MAKFFVDRPIVAMVLVHHHGDAGPGGDAGAADRAVPRDRPADGADHHDVCRRGRRRRRSRRRDAARTEDQRRREGHLPEVHQRQRRHVDVAGLVRGRQQPRHGQRPDAEPRVGSDAAAAAGREELRRRRQEGPAVPAARHLGQVAERDVRQQLPVQLRDDQHQRQHRAYSWCRTDQPVRRQRLRDARVAATRSHRQSRDHRSRHRQRDQPAEPVEPGWPDRRPARGARHRVHLHGTDAGAPPQRGGVRRHHRPHQYRRLRSPAEGRGQARTRHAAVQRRRATQWQAVGGDRGLPDSRHQRPAGGQGDHHHHGGSQDALPARHGVRDLAGHDAAGHRRHHRDRPHAVRGRGPRDHRGVHLPAELACDADSAADRAGLADRRVHVLPAARLLHQRVVAAGPRARHRHRRRRCDRRGRGGDAPSRARDGAEGRDAEGDGRGLGPRRRDRAHPDCGVRAGRVHGRHHRRALPAVRNHDRAVGGSCRR